MLKRSKARDGAKCEEGEVRCGVGAEPTVAREGERERVGNSRWMSVASLVAVAQISRFSRFSRCAC